MSNYDMSKYMVDVPIPFGERLTIAIQCTLNLLYNSATCFLLAPVAFFRNLCNKTRRVVDVSKLPSDHPYFRANVIQHEHRIADDDEEEWMKEHKENFGD